MRLFTRNLVRGSTHLCQGQEAVSVGACSALDEGDTMTCTYRGHGAVLAMGAPLDRSLAEILGKPHGLCGGRGGSMHLTDIWVGALGSFAVVGAHLPFACGTGFAAQVLGTGSVSLCFFGDGTTNIGAFHEALNLASIWKLPVVFVCENNLYGEYSPIASTTPVDRAGRASGELRDPRRSHRRQRRHGRRRGGAGGSRAGRGRRRADHDRGDDLPAHGPLAQRSGDLPAGGRARGVASSATRSPASRPRWRSTMVWRHRTSTRPGRGRRPPSPRRCSGRSTGPSPIRRAGSTTSGRPGHERAADLSRGRHPRARRRAGERRARGADRRGRRRCRRRVQGDRGAVRAVRLAARARHADLGAGDRRHRAGRGGGRAAAGRRDHVRRLRGRLLRPDRQPAGQVPLPVRRPGDRPGDAADGRRRQPRLRRAALAVRRELVPQHARG